MDSDDEMIRLTCQSCGAIIEAEEFGEAMRRGNEHFRKYCPGRTS